MSTKDDIKALEERLRDTFKGLSDCSALRDLDGLAQGIQQISYEANEIQDREVTDKQDARLQVIQEACNEASVAVDEMSNLYTVAHQALTRVVG
jgi:hypothetical protein